MVGLLSMVAQLQMHPGHKEMNIGQSASWNDGTARFGLPRSSITRAQVL